MKIWTEHHNLAASGIVSPQISLVERLLLSYKLLWKFDNQAMYTTALAAAHALGWLALGEGWCIE